MTRTADFAVATAVVSMGVSLIDIEYVGSRAFFVFEDEIRFAAIEDWYYQGKLYVNARDYSDNSRRLMARIKTMK